MISSPTLPSPFHRLANLSALWDIDLYIKRDDLIPQFMGGNKVRKTFEILRSMESANGLPDVLITNGGAESNHARVVALMGAQLGCKVHLVLHGSTPRPSLRGNSFFYRSAGAETHYVEASDIERTINNIDASELAAGRSVFIIPGGGHSAEGALAYQKACFELPFEPDYIIHASGTGGTQAGLHMGAIEKRWRTRIIGISVARTAERGIDEIAKLLPKDMDRRHIDFRDNYRFGGYDCFNDELISFVERITRLEGIPLDLTYTGKAMFGLEKIVAAGEIGPGSQVVFWHTGGLLNLQSKNLGEYDERK